MKKILIAMFLMIAAPVYAQGTVQVTNTTGIPTSNAAGWQANIVKSDSGYLAMKNGRVYTMKAMSITETTPEMTNVFDFENEVVLHTFNAGRQAMAVSSFTEVSGSRISELTEYGCYMVRNARSSELLYFAQKKCR